jgi:hypothetical protein
VHLVSALTVVGLTLATSSLVTGGAVADVDKPPEGKGDVVVVTSSGGYSPSDQSTNVDITSHVVKYGKTLSIKTKYADLVAPKTGDLIGVETLLKVKGGLDFEVTAGADAGHKSGTPRLFKEDSQTTCKGMKAKFDYTKRTVTTTVPSSCLGNPAWLRYWSQSSYTDASDDYFFDLAGSPKYSDSPKYSAKLHKG